MAQLVADKGASLHTVPCFPYEKGVPRESYRENRSHTTAILVDLHRHRKHLLVSKLMRVSWIVNLILETDLPIVLEGVPVFESELLLTFVVCQAHLVRPEPVIKICPMRLHVNSIRDP